MTNVEITDTYTSVRILSVIGCFGVTDYICHYINVLIVVTS